MMLERNYSVWGVSINSGYSKTLSHTSSNHFYIISDSDMSEHETFYFSSPHLHNIDVKNPEIAFYRAKALLRLMNGIRELQNSTPIMFDSRNIFYFKDFGSRNHFTVRGNPQSEYEELQNPFLDKEVLNNTSNTQSSKIYEVDLFELAYNEELVKEVLILFSLLKIEPLYFLINTSKILETIQFDLGFPPNEKSIEKLKEIHVLSNQFWGAYKFFNPKDNSGSFSHFINTRKGSGIFARHGANKRQYKSELPWISFEEIEQNIQKLIYEWINYKLISSKGYSYHPIERTSRIVALKDEDFDL